MPAHNRPLRVLHLEDNDRDAERVRECLDQFGLPAEIDRVGEQRAFADRLKASRYDLILSDYQAAPAFPGLPALKRAREAQPNTPFLFVAGALGEEIAAEAAQSGARGYVRKDRLGRLPIVVEHVLAHPREQDANHRAAEILANIAEAFLLLDAEGRITTVNPAFERLLATSSEAVVGRLPYEVLSQTRGPRIDLEIQHALAHREPLEFDTLLTPPGRWFSARVTPIPEGGLALFLHDIDASKRDEQALVDRELRYRLVADISRDVIYDWDLVSDHLIWSDGLTFRFGHQKDAVIPEISWWYDHIHPDDLERIAESIRRHLFSGQERWEGEYRFRRADGSYAPVHDRAWCLRDASGEMVRMVGTMLDLTEHNRVREALRDAEDRFALVRRSCGVGFWYSDLPFDALLWDDLVKSHFFIPPDAEVTKQLAYSRIHPDDRLAVRNAVALAIERHEPYDFDHRTVDPHTGAVRWLRAIGRTTYGDDGIPRRFDGITLDVTAERLAAQERERLLQAAQQARDEAQAANDMKDEFLATLSHELRSPLCAIVGWIPILRANPGDASLLEEGLEVIHRNARAQSQLIEDLLDISRIVSGKLALEVHRVRLQDIIEAAIATVMPAAAARGVQIQHRLDPLASPVSGDSSRLQQVVWNLLSNAIKFTPQSGTVQVLLQRVDPNLEIQVADSGQGIRPDFLPYVFDRFRQADGSTTRRFSGLGLGLAIVKHLVEMHGGTVRAQSPGEGQGATFIVSLPIAASHPAPVVRDPTEGPPRTLPSDDHCACDLRGLRALVLDDEPDARTLLRRVLLHRGIEVEVAGSVPDALELVDSFQPGVIVSDVGIPDQDGYDFIRQVRAQHPARKLPAIALTAFARDEDRIKALRAGFQIHLAKPVQPGELIAVIANLTDRNGYASPAIDGP